MLYQDVINLIDSLKNIKLWKINKENKDILLNIKKKYSNIKNLSELFYLIENKDNLQNLHIFCPVCGKKNNFLNKNKGYCSYCSRKCSNSDDKKKLKTEENNLKKYGVRHTFQSLNNKIKTEQTMLKKYGVKHFTNTIKAVQTRKNDIDCDGLDSYKRASIKGIIKGKLNIDENGLNSYQRGNLKSQITKQKRYGDKYYTNINKHKETCLKKYNKEYYTNRKKALITMLLNIDNNGLNGFERQQLKSKKTKQLKYSDPNYNNRKQAEKTCLQKYGVKNYMQTEEWKNILLNNKDIIKQKVYNTKLKNNTFNTSKPEEYIYLRLKQKFPDVVHYYKSHKYPYNCDFYIPTKDLFIELNFHWTHGFEPFDKNNKQHLEKLNDWKNKSKNSKFYKQAIYVWTELDVKKLEIFKNNNLNYKIFYTEKEFNKWEENLNAL